MPDPTSAASPEAPQRRSDAAVDSPQPAALAVTVWTLIIVAGFALSLLRVMAVNLPWHLATARLAQQTGHWLAVNTFSYTFHDYPVYQQYPAFQWAMWTIFRIAGWGGLSVATAVGWMLAFLLVVRWGGTFRQGARFHVLWMLALWALQRRMIMRPDMFSMIAFGIELLALDAFARGKTRALAAAPLAHLLWVNSHQLWPLSLMIQGLAVVDLAWRRDRRRAQLAALALGVSVLLTFATPLGFAILRGPLRTAQSLSLFREQVDEFHRVWTMSHESSLALATGLPAVWMIWRTRRRPSLFDLGLWFLSLALLISAVRGLMFFGVVSVAVFQRGALRTAAAGERLLPPLSAITRRILRVAGLTITVVTAWRAVYFRWIEPPFTLGGTQAGLGRAWGGWAEAATDFIRRAPPPGRMLNLGMGLGDDVIFWVPGIPVFVDSRLESYPPEFLRTVMAAQTDDAELAKLLDRYGVQWVFAVHSRPALRDRIVFLLRAGWQPVYVDSGQVILVRASPETAAYRRDHAIDLRHAQPGDVVPQPPAIRKEQQDDFAALIAALDREPVR